jgi:hypothetical protein
MGESQVGILGAQHRRGDSWEIFGHNDRRGFGVACSRRILGIRDERDFTRLGLLNAVDPGDLEVRQTVFKAGIHC